MSNVGYDLDTSGGLMPLIRALIKPPDEDSNGQKNKKPQHPYYKRPGKGHNRDSCDACGEGGDLICCDRCPASFHLGCYDPPLEESDIPAGLWLCRQCRAGDDNAPPPTRTSRPQSPVEEKDDNKRTLRNKKKSKDDKEEETREGNDAESVKEEEKELTPMEILVKAAKIMNPKQFELPREMRVPCLFPGTDKDGSAGPAVVSVDSAGLVPLPARLCFVCNGTCRHAPLLQCDYCPLLFHQDCLDPPLTALPTGRWMCPNHVEQYIDFKLVNSISATERVALWDKFSGPVDQHAIKVDFIRRARTHRPRFRIRVPAGVRGRTVVPRCVRAQYSRPPPLLPSRREHLRCLNVLKSHEAAEDMSEEEGDTPHAVCVDSECVCAGWGDPGRPGTPDHHMEALEDAKSEKSQEVSEGESSGSESDASLSRLCAAPAKAKIRLTHKATKALGNLPRTARQALRRIDTNLAALLAWQRLQQLLAGDVLARSPPPNPRLVLDRAKLAKYGFHHVALPSELLCRTERERIARAVWGGGVGVGVGVGVCGAVGESPPPRPHAPTLLDAMEDTLVRAALCPVLRPARNGLGDGLGRPIAMRRARLSVGASSACDVTLDSARCRCVSPLHALIFYDEVTRHFELLNYSEWGSRVNGVLYACDVTPRASPPATLALRTRIRTKVRLNGALTEVPSQQGGNGNGNGSQWCRCAPRPPSAAWEGGALLPHGALLSFGCLMFVFSIAGGAEVECEPAL